MDLTGSTSAPSAAGPVIATPGSNQGTTSAPESSSQSGMNNGYRISPVNPKGQAPTIMGPGG
jgi:predicted CoA-binding protein